VTTGWISADSHLTEPGDCGPPGSRRSSLTGSRTSCTSTRGRPGSWKGGRTGALRAHRCVPAMILPTCVTGCTSRRCARAVWDPKERINELDADNVDARCLFPNRPWRSVVANTDSDLHHAMVRPTTTGCRSTAAMPPTVSEAVRRSPAGASKEAVAEIERTAEMDGFVPTC